MNTLPEDKYQEAVQERQKHVDAIIAAVSRKKIVVAGPGTGKTYLFKKLLSGKTKTLTLTFVNSLVEDLSLELCGISDVKTLHAYARSALGAAGKKSKIFAKLSTVIAEDAKILLQEEINFDHLFHNRIEDKARIEFYKKRKDYYDVYGFSDIVYAVVKYFEQNKDRIPIYEQVVVDEFQDFNKLEVSLIDLLAEKNPILLAGDDDQALYGDLKSASAEHIRQRHANPSSGYNAFTLPFCSRCTRVLVQAVNDIIANATQAGHLKGRLNKPYKYFDDKNKDKQSAANPKIIHGKFYAAKIPYAIEKLLFKVAQEERGKFSVLIISPTKNQSRLIVDSLKEKGLGSIEAPEHREGSEPTMLDGLKVLLEDAQSNLGWRIVAKHLAESTSFETFLKKSHEDTSVKFVDLISHDDKVEVKQMLTILRAVRDGKCVKEDDLERTLKFVGISALEMAKAALAEEIGDDSQRTGYSSIRKIPVKGTTIQSSKGLAADYVFITHFDDQYFIKAKSKKDISDQDICNFLVAMTRARKRVFLISSDMKKDPTFLNWMNTKDIEGPGFYKARLMNSRVRITDRSNPILAKSNESSFP